MTADLTLPCLAALRELRDATENALAALERDDADGASRAVERGALASQRVGEALGELGRVPVAALAEARAILALEGLALERAEARREEVGGELAAIAGRKRGVMGYRAGTADPALVDREM